MNTSDERRRSQEPARQGPGQGDRQARQRKAPLFPLEAGDVAATARQGPPAPLGDLLSDLDAAMPAPSPPRRVMARTPEPAPRERVAPAAPPGVTAAPAERGFAPRREGAAPQAAPQRPVLTQAPAQRQRQELRPTPQDELLEALSRPVESARARYHSIDADLARLELSEARPRLGGGYVPLQAPPALSLNGVAILGVICLASLLVLFTMGGGSAGGLSRWNPLQRLGESVDNSRAALFAVARPAGDYNLKGPPSLTPQQIERILESYGSPAVGTGEVWYRLGQQYGIDPAFAIAFFIHESSAGSNQAWAGIKPGGVTTHNVGNIICAGYATCYGRFRDYASWGEGIDDWYRLIDVEYLQGRGHQTVADIIPVYAPSFENDVQAYVDSVNSLVDAWRTAGVQ